MIKIFKIKARQILDSRGQPTIEVDLWLESGAWGRAAVPAGASRGAHEAVELRDGGAAFGGRGVSKALQAITEIIAPAISGKSFDQTTLDGALIKLDGTKNKSQLGANSILAVSLAFAKAVAKSQQISLWRHFNNLSGNIRTPKIPIPLCNVMNGGAHAAGAVDFQEFMIIPSGLPTIGARLKAAAEIYTKLGELLKAEHKLTLVGDEGGYGAIFPNNEKPLELMMRAIEGAGYKPGQEVFLGLDVAASQFTKSGQYILTAGHETRSTEKMIDWYAELLTRYPLLLIEDPLAEDDWDGFRLATERLGRQVLIVGDDLFTTNPERIERGIKNRSANAVLIKLNQIGTLTETLQAIRLTYQAGWEAVISHRSGETEDTTIAHLAVGVGAKFIKSGAPARGERTAKYNELLRISEEVIG